MATKTVIIESMVKCAGGRHAKITGTIDGAPKTLVVDLVNLSNWYNDVILEQRFWDAVYFLATENNLTTFAQLKSFLEGKTIKI